MIKKIFFVAAVLAISCNSKLYAGGQTPGSASPCISLTTKERSEADEPLRARLQERVGSIREACIAGDVSLFRELLNQFKTELERQIILFTVKSDADQEIPANLSLIGIAIYRHDLPMLDAILAEGLNAHIDLANAFDSRERSPLHVAIECDCDFVTIRRLLAAGADPTKFSEGEIVCPLAGALLRGQTDIACCLIRESKIDPDASMGLNCNGSDLLTPLMIAALLSNPKLREMVPEFFERNKFYLPDTPAEVAARVSDEYMLVIDALIDKGASVHEYQFGADENAFAWDHCRWGHDQPFHYELWRKILQRGCREDNLPTVESLLANLPDDESLAFLLRSVDDERRTWMHEAASSRRGCSVVSTLLEAGFSVNDRDVHGNMPLHTALACRNTDAARLILEYMLDTNEEVARLTPEEREEYRVGIVNLPGARGRMPLHLAVLSGDVDVVRFLVQAGANVCGKAEDGLDPLALAERLAPRSEQAAAIRDFLRMQSIEL